LEEGGEGDAGRRVKTRVPVHGLAVLALIAGLLVPARAHASSQSAAAVDVVYDPEEPGLTLPILKHRVAPNWPAGVRFGTRANVKLRARVAADGTVVATNVLHATDRRFADEARRTVSKWRYTPGMKDGRPVDVWFDVIIDWRALGDGGGRTAAVAHRVSPTWTEAMVSKRRNGDVEMEVRVGTDGRVKAARVLRSDDPDFTAPAIEAVREWRFEPAWANDEPIESTETVIVEFWWREGRKQLQDGRERTP
jgi:TonB family protein